MIKWITDRIIPRPFIRFGVMNESPYACDRVENIQNYYVDLTASDIAEMRCKLIWMTKNQYKNLDEFTGF